MTSWLPQALSKSSLWAGHASSIAPSSLSTRLACWIASGASLAISAAQAWASAKVPMRFAIPVCSAISAVSFSALSSIARARPCPTNDDSRRMLQLSRARPYFDVGNWKKASGATTRRSHCMASCKPAPMAGPLIAPTTGIGEASIALCSSMSRSG
ncbi:Uncharacterised protein [Mycobacterium tuberculosis]|uniref:Uncharacterized protein n=1 Tax=Mycobacterium tuberculosis TaxID=1773 RepID=A0A0U0S404_MYCTX|nr:Uncharacterised protein [Mycobacterium tuberculosis]COX14814.1 Uncharacterised protein [Mycobacterium tuberculosis]